MQARKTHIRPTNTYTVLFLFSTRIFESNGGLFAILLEISSGVVGIAIHIVNALDLFNKSQYINM